MPVSHRNYILSLSHAHILDIIVNPWDMNAWQWYIDLQLAQWQHVRLDQDMQDLHSLTYTNNKAYNYTISLCSKLTVIRLICCPLYTNGRFLVRSMSFPMGSGSESTSPLPNGNSCATVIPWTAPNIITSSTVSTCSASTQPLDLRDSMAGLIFSPTHQHTSNVVHHSLSLSLSLSFSYNTLTTV